MKFGFAFLAIGALLFVQSIILGGYYLWLLWPTLSFAIVGLAYLYFGPALLGKKQSGAIHPALLLVLLPYFTFTWLTWHVVRVVYREPPYVELLPNLYIGRRLLDHEMPNSFTAVVDLAAEFRETRAARQKLYFSLPTLDGCALCSEAAFRATAIEVAKYPGPVYIHCAQGHGRTAMFAALLLVYRQSAASIDEAIDRIRAVRPRISIKQDQLQMIRRLAKSSVYSK